MNPLCLRALMTTVVVVGLGINPAFGQDRPAGGTFPVTIRIDASRPLGEMKPVWRFFGHDEPNYTYMTDGKKLLGQLAALSPRAGLHPHAQPADFRRRHPGPQVGLHRRLFRGRRWQAPLRLDDPRPHLRYLQGTGRPALRPDRLHARGPLHPSGPLPAPLDAGRQGFDLHRLGLPAQGL